MTKVRTLQILRGTTVQNDAYTGSAGELTMDTTTNELRLHDGSTVGGHIIGAGGSGAVNSVNGKTGVVVLTATDVGALPDSTVIPDAQIQSDWNQADNTKVDFIKNKPTIPAAQVNSDWNANSGVAQILNKPTLATVASSGSYNDLTDKPTIPTVGNGTITITQGGTTKGSFTTNQSGNTTIDLDAGGDGSSYHPDLFDYKWADHICNDVQWLRSDTFSWQSGAVYQVAYQHLVDDIDGKTLQSETVSGTTIQFYLADDGHKICPASEESNVTAIYNATGVAWYYIIDTTNQRFKLPRAKHNKYANSLGVVGNGMALGLTDGTYNAGLLFNSGGTLQPYQGNYGGEIGITHSGSAVTSIKSGGVTTDPTKSGIIAQQEQDTDQYKYLYFYVGAFTQTAIENTAGLNTELFNQKADLNLNNTASNIDFVIERQEPTAGNGYTWYRKYKSGWVEQGGICAPVYTGTTVSFPTTMANTNYQFQLSVGQGQLTGTVGSVVDNRTTTGMTVYSNWSSPTQPGYICWQVSGMAA